MNEILEIAQKLKRYKNFKVALDAVSEDILNFTDTHRIVVFKKEIQEPTNAASLNLFYKGSLKKTDSIYFEKNFDKSLPLKDYISIYSESLISNTPISFNPDLLNPLTDKTIFDYYKGKDVKSSLVIPLILHNEVWGIIVFHDLKKVRNLGAEIFTKARIVSELIINSIVFWEHENKASLDSLDEHSYRMASLGKLAASIAHEMNNQIFLINGFTAKIEKILKLTPELFNDNLKLYIDSIQKSCNRSTEIVEALRVTTRSTKYEQLEVCDLNYLISNLVNLSKEKARKDGISFEISSPEEELLIECKPGQVMQVLTNLVNNSFDVLESLESKKIIRILSKIEKGQVIVEFSDSGVKPRAEIIENMMEPFFSTKPLGRGCGLGLSICKQIMRKFNGDIVLDQSKANTTFCLNFPLVMFEDNS